MPLLCKWWLEQPTKVAWWPWLLIFWHWNCCEMSAVSRTTVLPILVFLRLVVVEIWEIWANTLQTDDVTSTLTFNLSISKWGHGSPVSWASFLPIFSLLRPSILDLGSGTGQTDEQMDGQTDTDRQTDRQRRPMHYAPPRGPEVQ